MKSVTLKEVRQLKEKAIAAMMINDPRVLIPIYEEIDAYLNTNRFQILDILEDALTGYEENWRKDRWENNYE
jgi:hypothetical protein